MVSRRESGYSLIEMMVVVTLIAVVTALAAPHIGEALRNNAASDAANEIVLAFRAARSSAARDGRSYIVRVSAGQKAVVVDRGCDNNCTPPAGCNWAYPAFGGSKCAGSTISDCGVKSVHLGALTYYSRAKVVFKNVNVNSAAAADPTIVCITPLGRMVNVTAGAPVPMAGPLEMELWRGMGIARRVFVPANGLPRVTL